MDTESPCFLFVSSHSIKKAFLPFAHFWYSLPLISCYESYQCVVRERESKYDIMAIVLFKSIFIRKPNTKRASNRIMRLIFDISLIECITMYVVQLQCKLFHNFVLCARSLGYYYLSVAVVCVRFLFDCCHCRRVSAVKHCLLYVSFSITPSLDLSPFLILSCSLFFPISPFLLTKPVWQIKCNLYLLLTRGLDASE